jgi:hypothetical protein
MDLQEKELLEETLEVSKENNRMLKKIWRDVKYKRFIKVVYWVIIIGLTLGAYYYIQPIIDSITVGYGGMTDALTTGLENIKRISDLIPSSTQ